MQAKNALARHAWRVMLDCLMSTTLCASAASAPRGLTPNDARAL
jgi:hypothetical protein